MPVSKLMSQPMSQPKRRILIIEDEALVVHELRGRLDRMGFDVVGVASGSEAVGLARETLPDLLLTDIHLKNNADGIDVALAIQRERRVPVVFLTAYSDEETVSRAKAVTPYGFIIKPVDQCELQIAIDLALYHFNIERELRETGISPSALILEITEGVAMQDVDRNIVILKALHAMGLGISIDDFGTGYSSLAYLKRLPLNTLKIDQCFIHDIATSAEDLEITRAIIALGHNLNLNAFSQDV